MESCSAATSARSQRARFRSPRGCGAVSLRSKRQLRTRRAVCAAYGWRNGVLTIVAARSRQSSLDEGYGAPSAGWRCHKSLPGVAPVALAAAGGRCAAGDQLTTLVVCGALACSPIVWPSGRGEREAGRARALPSNAADSRCQGRQRWSRIDTALVTARRSAGTCREWAKQAPRLASRSVGGVEVSGKPGSVTARRTTRAMTSSSRPDVAARLEPPTRGRCEQHVLPNERPPTWCCSGWRLRVSPVPLNGSDSSLWPCSSPSSTRERRL